MSGDTLYQVAFAVTLLAAAFALRLRARRIPKDPWLARMKIYDSGGTEIFEGTADDLVAEIRRLRQTDAAFKEWIALSDWVQEEFTAGRFKGGAGQHRATIMRQEIERLRAIVEEGPSAT